MEASPVNIIEGDCLEVLPTIQTGSIDAVICDPPYPHIRRSYGYWTEAEWFALMDPVVAECRRVLTPTGSAVFVLQPNSERVGRMRPWLFEFQAKWCREWGMVQDAYWWNYNAMPEAHAIQGRLMRPSVKPCVWLGASDCYRDQDAVLWAESDESANDARCGRANNYCPSGHKTRRERIKSAPKRRGGVTPFNVLPMANSNSVDSAGSHGHGAGTPEKLARWWVRYICPPGGLVLDPFLGSGTVALAALAEGRRAVGVERDAGYAETARKRIAAAAAAPGLFAGAA